MKPTIYFLDDNIGNGKPKLIAGLIKSLQEFPQSNPIVFYSDELISDVLCVIEISGIKVGMMSHENPAQSAGNLLSNFWDKGCEIIFCTSIRMIELNKVVSGLVTARMVRSVRLKSIWSSVIRIDRLVEYEISKLVEIVEIHIDTELQKANSRLSHLIGTGSRQARII